VDENQQKISVILSATELDRFNCYCTDRGYKKSTLIRRLIREHLERENFPAADHHDGTRTRTPDPNAKRPHHGRSRNRVG
jgi:hypothetical protein